MANRSFQNEQYCLVKRKVDIYCAVLMSGTTPLLQKWNYPTLGVGTNARTYTNAPSASALPSGNPYPLQYNAGAEGVRSVTRTAAGFWTFKLQDNYQRNLALSFTEVRAGDVGVIATMALNASLLSAAAVGGTEFGVIFMDYAGVAVDPTTSVLLTFTMQDATEP